MKLENLDHIALTVKDVDKSVKWYCEVLGLERRYEEVWKNRPAMVCAGDTCVAIFPSSDKNTSERKNWNEGISIIHFAFRVNKKEFENSKKELSERGIKFTFEDHTASHSIYFSDPDGHQLEITTYEI